jgi:hypothetical protein
MCWAAASAATATARVPTLIGGVVTLNQECFHALTCHIQLTRADTPVNPCWHPVNPCRHASPWVIWWIVLRGVLWLAALPPMQVNS